MYDCHWERKLDGIQDTLRLKNSKISTIKNLLSKLRNSKEKVLNVILTGLWVSIYEYLMIIYTILNLQWFCNYWVFFGYICCVCKLSRIAVMFYGRKSLDGLSAFLPVILFSTRISNKNPYKYNIWTLECLMSHSLKYVYNH